MTFSATVVRDYERDGFIRIRRFLEEALLAEVTRNVERYVREVAPMVPPGDRVLEPDGVNVRNLWRMETHDPFFADLPHSGELLTGVAQLVHGEPLLMGIETFNKPPRVGSGVPPHQDNAYFCQSPPDVLTIWIALDAATELNGPILYISGSHREMHPHRQSGVAGNSMGLTTMPEHAESQIFRATLEPGDAMIHHCQTVHWSAPNKTDRPRCGLLMVFRAAHTQYDKELKQSYDKAAKGVQG